MAPVPSSATPSTLCSAGTGRCQSAHGSARVALALLVDEAEGVVDVGDLGRGAARCSTSLTW